MIPANTKQHTTLVLPELGAFCLLRFLIETFRLQYSALMVMFGICRIYDAATGCGNQSGLLHEPINNNQNDKIDQETFDIVQRIRDGRRRLSPMGEMPILSGILFCADCGSKLYQVRGRGWEHRKYTDIKELDAEMIREFVAKIIVHKAEKADGHRVQRIRIIYNDIGVIELPKPTGHEKTA